MCPPYCFVHRLLACFYSWVHIFLTRLHFVFFRYDKGWVPFSANWQLARGISSKQQKVWRNLKNVEVVPNQRRRWWNHVLSSFCYWWHQKLLAVALWKSPWIIFITSTLALLIPCVFVPPEVGFTISLVLLQTPFHWSLRELICKKGQKLYTLAILLKYCLG